MKGISRGLAPGKGISQSGHALLLGLVFRVSL